MADKNNRVKGYVEGKYYVDSTCIGCGMCEGTLSAPENFKMKDDCDLAIVFK
jgi:ferredoxin